MTLSPRPGATPAPLTPEQGRLLEADQGLRQWRRWGPYLSERQWGTVREDDSTDGNAWDAFSHDQARSRAYRWGEDGLAGICDDRQLLCFALALWNGKDPILKERLFGLTNSEGNHGEDVKEYYYYLDSTPTHSYMRWLYKYPLNAYPYDDLVATNKERSRLEPEYELIDTGIFDDQEYCDVEVEYAKADQDDLLVQISVHNRSARRAEITVLPTLWFRRTWGDVAADVAERPLARAVTGAGGDPAIEALHPQLGSFSLHCRGAVELVFADNETNAERIYGRPSPSPYTKCGIHRYLIEGDQDAVNPAGLGTKASAIYRLAVPAAGTAVIRLRLGQALENPYGDFEAVLAQRRQECDTFYDALMPPALDAEQRRLFRQSMAGMLWSKQLYTYDVSSWLQERGVDPLERSQAGTLRNSDWPHMRMADVISMPDKWEYPWFAAWDLAFHADVFAWIDPQFAKQQLSLMLSSRYLHPNGQIPAYEWNFGDVNPPVHAWATLAVYQRDAGLTGQPDRQWLASSFHKLAMNFTWWLNRKDVDGNNVFRGGFLGLDNIGVFDRTESSQMGGTLDQADATAWMALYAQNMLRMAVELAMEDEDYEDYVQKFLMHHLSIAEAMTSRCGGESMWDDDDGFFYDVLRRQDGSSARMKIRSIVGLLPLCAVSLFNQEVIERFPELGKELSRFLDRHQERPRLLHDTRQPGHRQRHLMAMLDEHNLRRMLAIMLDPDEFLGEHGIRSISRRHESDPCRFVHNQQEYVVRYLPAESDSGLFGGNSN
ncbi:MAG: glucosidase, partial [Synechococcaceae cyanobacterium]|nr:glucosidase [Synechococcaceae cyanobacterium]